MVVIVGIVMVRMIVMPMMVMRSSGRSSSLMLIRMVGGIRHILMLVTWSRGS